MSQALCKALGTQKTKTETFIVLKEPTCYQMVEFGFEPSFSGVKFNAPSTTPHCIPHYLGSSLTERTRSHFFLFALTQHRFCT